MNLMVDHIFIKISVFFDREIRPFIFNMNLPELQSFLFRRHCDMKDNVKLSDLTDRVLKLRLVGELFHNTEINLSRETKEFDVKYRC